MTVTSPLRIAYVYDSRVDYLARGLSEEECAEFDSEDTIQSVAASLRKLGTVEMVGNVYQVVSCLAAGAKADWDIVFNYAEGVVGVGREAQVPAILEAYGVDFTLSDTATQAICLDKCKTKMVLAFYGVPSSPFAVFHYNPSGTHQKHPALERADACGEAEAALESPKVHNQKDLEAGVAELTSLFQSDIIIEPYLAGREFNVGVFGTGQNAKVAFDAGLGYLFYDIKNGAPSEAPKFTKCDMEDPVIQAVADVGLRAWKAMGCWDAGTVDIRHDVMGENARPCVLEVNTIPGLSKHAAFTVMAQLHGINFDTLISNMTRGGIQRRAVKEKI